MVYFFACVGAALGRVVEDVHMQNRWLWVRLREKGGKRHSMPYPPYFEEYLTFYFDSAGLLENSKPQANAYAMVRRRGIGRKSQSS
jgi:hypothetical protein